MATVRVARRRRGVVFIGEQLDPVQRRDFEMAAIVVRSRTRTHRPVEVI